MTGYVCRACGEDLPCYLVDRNNPETLPTGCPWHVGDVKWVVFDAEAGSC